MTDPRIGEATPLDALSDMERNARVEQLLVAGLDEYFAGRLDHAVNVWTRVLFLDRANDRARAYIDRARRAQAERQRETEALMHQGMEAFDEGDVERARRLLTAAVERGAPHEQTLPILHRIGLLDLAPPPPAATNESLARRWRRPGGSAGTPPLRTPIGPLLVTAAAIAVAALVLARTDAGSTPATPAAAYDAMATPLPVPASSEVHLARADAFFRAGKLADALATLDRVGPGDSLYRDAQVLRGRVQRELLNATAGLIAAGTEPAAP
jgi:hypothetical protein